MYWKDETRNNAVSSKLSVSSLSTLTSGSSYLKERKKNSTSARVDPRGREARERDEPGLLLDEEEDRELDYPVDGSLGDDAGENSLGYERSGRPLVVDLGGGKSSTHCEKERGKTRQRRAHCQIKRREITY